MNMKKFLVTMLCLMVMSATAQEVKRVIVPGKGGIDVEQLNKGVNLDQDISQLNLTELRVLRNSFYAREGFPFRDAFLRGLFQCTSWYDSLMWVRWGKVENLLTGYERDEYYKADGKLPFKISKSEYAFINKLQAREKELKLQNFNSRVSGHHVNMDNVVNAMQMDEFDARLKDKLGRNGFAIVPAQHNQLFQVYETNDYSNFPNFVTTDLYLQLYHLYFDCLLRDIEQEKLHDVVLQLCERGRELTTGTTTEQKWLRTYFDVGCALIKGEKGAAGTVADEVEKVNHSEADTSAYLGYKDIFFSYPLFRPRGHYTRNDTLKTYFKAMMWLQTVPFGTDNPLQLQTALVLAELTAEDTKLRDLYQQLYEPMTWLFGLPDNITIMQVYELMKGRKASELVKNKKAMTQLREEIETLAQQQTRIRPKFEYTSSYKINLLPQRYMPDSEVLLEMVDYDNHPTLRDLPKGLDVMASMGVKSAERILIDELHEVQQWDGFVIALSRMKERMKEIDWQQTISTRWMDALKVLNDTCNGYPYFMLTPEWQKKDLNAALASWAELKHDAILYAKQPFGAECGGGGPPDPIVTGYVEPNVKFWQRAISLLEATADVLERYHLTTEKAENATSRLKEEAEFLLRVSERELTGKKLAEADYDELKHIGATFENISLDLVRDKDMYLMGWDDVEGTDRKVALIADVYTANADNNPEKSVMYVGVGMADEIYCIVEVDGYLWLMRGAVLSYRETKRPLDMQRMTDEEWQKRMEADPEEGRPVWMKDVIVPLKEVPHTNERFFYSTGC
jgi:hypothetical protein